MTPAWDGEDFETTLTSAHWVVSDPGPLRGPVLSFSIRRNHDYRIELVTISESSFPLELAEMPTQAETVFRATDVVRLSGIVGTVSLNGVIPLRLITSSDHISKVTRYEQHSLVHSIVQLPPDANSVGFMFEWVNNMQLDGPLPNRLNIKSEDMSVLSFPDSPIPFTIRSGTKGGHGSSCYSVILNGREIIFGMLPKAGEQTQRHEAYILYQGDVPEPFRRKFRDCLSFAFGRPLIYLGYRLLTPDSVECGFEVVAGFNADHARYAYVGLLPAPLFEGNYIIISEKVTTRLLTALFDNYDTLDFLHVSWLYWHGLCSALHSQAVQLGAAIEAVQTAYKAANPTAFDTQLMPTPKARPLLAAIQRLVEECDVDDGVKLELRKKIQHFNKPSQKVVNERFFEALKLPMGPEELNAWTRRNDAAHGNSTEDYRGLIKDIKLLMNTFARIVLRISGGSDFYVDYYTPRFPVRRLEEPVSSSKPPMCFTQPS